MPNTSKIMGRVVTEQWRCGECSWTKWSDEPMPAAAVRATADAHRCDDTSAFDAATQPREPTSAPYQPN